MMNRQTGQPLKTPRKPARAFLIFCATIHAPNTAKPRHEQKTALASIFEGKTALIGEQPEIGSKRYAKPPALQGLRMCPVPDFPKHWIFYIERPDHIDVLRVLHGARDIPVVLQED
jgi:plasmid stabilization system protein ParE